MSLPQAIKRAMRLHQEGRSDEAQNVCEAILQARPNNQRALNILIAIKLKTGKLADAAGLLERLVSLRPDEVMPLIRLGNALTALNRPDAAIGALDRALAIAPNSVLALLYKGNALQHQNLHAEAIGLYDRALEIKPGFVEAINNRGAAYHFMNRHRDALADYTRTVILSPNHASAHVNRGLILLSLGEYQAGFLEHEWRWKARGFKDGLKLGRPIWVGQTDIAGKTILVLCDQGFGDTIQFARYIEQLALRGARVILHIQSELSSLMSRIPNVEGIITQEERLPRFDMYIPFQSFPLAFATTVETIPASIPYLASDPARNGKWKEYLGNDPRMLVGLTFSGSPAHKNDFKRSVAATGLAALLGLDARFVILQPQTRDEDIEALKAYPNVLMPGPEIKDFDDTASIIEHCELVISVDTSVAHLAGAMGKAVWLMLPYSSDWRWLTGRDDSPWYPTARLFRQTASGDWASVTDSIATALLKRINKRS